MIDCLFRWSTQDWLRLWWWVLLLFDNFSTLMQLQFHFLIRYLPVQVQTGEWVDCSHSSPLCWSWWLSVLLCVHQWRGATKKWLQARSSLQRSYRIMWFTKKCSEMVISLKYSIKDAQQWRNILSIFSYFVCCCSAVMTSTKTVWQRKSSTTLRIQQQQLQRSRKDHRDHSVSVQRHELKKTMSEERNMENNFEQTSQ